MLSYLNPLNWFRWIGGFVTAWLLSIPWRDAPKAIPALVLIIVLVVTGSIALTEGSNWRARQIDRQLRRALEVDDYETAELVLRRQIQAKPQDSDLLYQLGQVLQSKEEEFGEEGAGEEAAAVMRELVVTRDHEPAARWLLQQQFLGRPWGELDESEQDEFGELLQRIHRSSPNDPRVQELLANYYMNTMRPAKAVPLLVELAGSFPTRGLQAAAIERSLGNEASADRLAEQTLTALQGRLREEPTNSMLALTVAQNQIFLERFTDAINTIAAAANRARTDEERAQLRQSLADAIALNVQNIESQTNRTLADRIRILRMLEKALEVAPNNPRVLTLVADQMLRQGDQEDETYRRLQQSLIEGASPGISHFIQGTAALMKDDVDKALMHLEIAAELLPNSGAILNNLAVALTSREAVDLERALQLSEAAIRQTPDATPHFYETRGQIHFRMGNYIKAVPDLERALTVPGLAVKAHETLATCYAELGDQELSEQHREAARRKAAGQGG